MSVSSDASRSPSAPPLAEADTSRIARWLTALAVMIAATMEVMDTSIANVALPHMQGTLSASTDEITWVLTSYLVANAIVIPLGGWFSDLFGRKRFFSSCVLVFTLSSAACGAAPNLESLVIFRILQGAAGGALIPLSQAIMLETFPPKEQGMSMALWGVGIMFSPIIGPFVGGWITDNYSWRWIFYVNLPIGLVALFLLGLFVHDPPYQAARRGRAASDWWGLAFLVVAIGSLQLMLDHGERENWFASDTIRWLAICGAAGGAAFVARELLTKDPVIDLRLFRDRTYASGTLLMGVMGFTLYGAIVLLPLQAQTLLGYSALEAGKIIAPGGIATLFTMPLAGALLSRMDARPLILTGTLLLAFSMHRLAGLNIDAGYWQLALPRIIMGFAFGLVFVPLSTTTMSGIAKEKMNAASGFYNLSRNIGGSVGIALVTTMLSRRGQFHQTTLVAGITPYDLHAREALARAAGVLAARGVEAAATAQGALAMIYAEIQRQATMNAFLDNYRLLGWMALLTVPLVFLLRRGSAAPPGPGAH